MDEYGRIEEALRNDSGAWRDYALCLSAPDDDDRIIFPWGKHPPTPEESEAWMQQYCDRCPVAQQCLDFGLSTESEGIWGGVELTPSRIARLKRLRIQEGKVTVERAKEVLGRGKSCGKSCSCSPCRSTSSEPPSSD